MYVCIYMPSVITIEFNTVTTYIHLSTPCMYTSMYAFVRVCVYVCTCTSLFVCVSAWL